MFHFTRNHGLTGRQALLNLGNSGAMQFFLFVLLCVAFVMVT